MDIANIARFMLFIGPISSAFDYATYFLMLWDSMRGRIPRCSRPDGSSSRCFRRRSSSTSPGPGAFLPYSHFAHALGLVPLSLGYWFALAGILILYLGLTQLVKGWLIRRFGLG